MDTIQQLLERELQAKIHTELTPYLSELRQNIADRVDTLIKETINTKIEKFEFPENSIHPKSIDISKLKLNKAQIPDLNEYKGIEDIAESIELTIMDNCVVVENTLVSSSVQSKDITADKLTVESVATDKQWYSDLKKDIIDSVVIPEQKDWSFKIAEIDAKVEVNRKNAGNLKELEVSGESLLSNVLYTTPGNNRVGINTMEPSDALTVWDQETEIVIGKHSSQQGYIGTRRKQNLNIGANNKVAVVLKTDGTCMIDNLQLMGRVISESNTIPGHAAKRGDIVLNKQPEVGSYIGWVCLDGLRWAGFGLING